MSSGGKSVLPKTHSSTAPGTPPIRNRTPQVTIEGTPAKAIISLSPNESVDATHAITGALAHALWQLRGGLDIANWVDAERLTQQLLTAPTESTPSKGPEVIVRKRTKSRAR